MWLFCKSGFFSAVQHFNNPDLIHVRARFNGDLECLCEVHGIKPCVTETPGNDYRYRMNFNRKDWARIVSQEAAEINYTNFKNAVHDRTERDDAYMAVWWDMRQHQD